jgi:hypothetical protein
MILEQSAKDQSVSTAEVIQLCAVDSLLFERVYFPKTARQKSPEMHRDLWEKLDGTDRLVNVLMSRGWGKTSKFRIFIAKRIAYRLSKTIMIVGASASHSRRTLRWIKKQVEKNTKFATDFGLSPGVPWTDDECQIKCKTVDGEEDSIWIVGMMRMLRLKKVVRKLRT